MFPRSPSRHFWDLFGSFSRSLILDGPRRERETKRRTLVLTKQAKCLLFVIVEWAIARRCLDYSSLSMFWHGMKEPFNTKTQICKHSCARIMLDILPNCYLPRKRNETNVHRCFFLSVLIFDIFFRDQERWCTCIKFDISWACHFSRNFFFGPTF